MRLICVLVQLYRPVILRYFIRSIHYSFLLNVKNVHASRRNLVTYLPEIMSRILTLMNNRLALKNINKLTTT